MKTFESTKIFIRLRATHERRRRDRRLERLRRRVPRARRRSRGFHPDRLRRPLATTPYPDIREPTVLGQINPTQRLEVKWRSRPTRREKKQSGVESRSILF